MTGLDIAIADLGSTVAHDGQVFLHLHMFLIPGTARTDEALPLCRQRFSTHLAQVDLVEFLRLYAWADILVLDDVVTVARLQVSVHRNGEVKYALNMSRVTGAAASVSDQPRRRAAPMCQNAPQREGSAGGALNFAGATWGGLPKWSWRILPLLVTVFCSGSPRYAHVVGSFVKCAHPFSLPIPPILPPMSGGRHSQESAQGVPSARLELVAPSINAPPPTRPWEDTTQAQLRLGLKVVAVHYCYEKHVNGSALPPIRHRQASAPSF